MSWSANAFGEMRRQAKCSPTGPGRMRPVSNTYRRRSLRIDGWRSLPRNMPSSYPPAPHIPIPPPSTVGTVYRYADSASARNLAHRPRSRRRRDDYRPARSRGRARSLSGPLPARSAAVCITARGCNERGPLASRHNVTCQRRTRRSAHGALGLPLRRDQARCPPRPPASAADRPLGCQFGCQVHPPSNVTVEVSTRISGRTAVEASI